MARSRVLFRSPQHFSKPRWRLLYIQVNSVPENRGKRIRFQARALFGDKSAGKLSPGHACTPLWVKTKGQLLVYLQPGTLHRVVYGDRLLILPVFREVSPPQNPAEFDYRRYLAGKDIYHQAFLSLKQWHYTGEHAGNPLIGGAADMKQRCVNLFHKAYDREEDAALLSAFVLRYPRGINPATEAAFAATLTITLLSVSGLHVVIMYWLVCLLLKPLGRF